MRRWSAEAKPEPDRGGGVVDRVRRPLSDAHPRTAPRLGEAGQGGLVPVRLGRGARRAASGPGWLRPRIPGVRPARARAGAGTRGARGVRADPAALGAVGADERERVGAADPRADGYVRRLRL